MICDICTVIVNMSFGTEQLILYNTINLIYLFVD